MATQEIIEFTHQAKVYRYTTSRKLSTIAGKLFSPIAANRSVIVKSESDTRDLEIEVPASNEVARLYLDRTPDATTVVTVTRVSGDTQHRYFTGKISEVKFSAELGGKLRASISCTPLLAMTNTQGLRERYTAGCNNLLYGPKCGLSFDAYAITATIKSITKSGFIIRSDDLIGMPEGHFTSGLALYKGAYAMVSNYDPATGEITLFNGVAGLKTGETIKVARGCDRSFEACMSFGNQNNFFGFPYIPSTDPWRTGIMRYKKP